MVIKAKTRTPGVSKRAYGISHRDFQSLKLVYWLTLSGGYLSGRFSHHLQQ
jgi:hypothetical protein